MIISLVNFTKIADAEVQRVIRAINRQITEDFEPYWFMGGRLRLEGRVGPKPEKQSLPELRGDAIIYLWDNVDVKGALGYHDENNRGLPFGVVFTKIAAQLDEHWSVTLSHEALELIADPNVNLLAAGPHPDPKEKGRIVFHWYEMSDAVQAETYEIDHVKVSNFVLPLYFTIGEQTGGRNDFLGSGAKSFGVNKGGYVGFFDPDKNDHDTYDSPVAGLAAKRRGIKSKGEITRRSLRYRGLTGDALKIIRARRGKKR